MRDPGKKVASCRSWSKVSIAAADRAGWRQSVEALCATWWEEGILKCSVSRAHLQILNMSLVHATMVRK